MRGAKPPIASPRAASGPLLLGAAAALALAAGGCAARPTRRPATAAEAAGILARWDGFRRTVLARP
ncbi:MAG TPA: type II secretion system protein M, partial [Thermoanaerobaculia bacterium]|nr:type II secretion system protein M [Thermoanaerobaculia bacterium]